MGVGCSGARSRLWVQRLWVWRRLLVRRLLVWGGITAFLAHIYLAEGGGVNVAKGGVNLSGPKIISSGP